MQVVPILFYRSLTSLQIFNIFLSIFLYLRRLWLVAMLYCALAMFHLHVKSGRQVRPSNLFLGKYRVI